MPNRTYVIDGVVPLLRRQHARRALPAPARMRSNNVTLPHALRIANLGWKAALKGRLPTLPPGLNVHEGKSGLTKLSATELGYYLYPGCRRSRLTHRFARSISAHRRIVDRAEFRSGKARSRNIPPTLPLPGRCAPRCNSTSAAISASTGKPRAAQLYVGVSPRF